MLPQCLWLLISAALAAAQSKEQLSLDSLGSFNESLSFTLPSAKNLTVSVAACNSNSQSLRFFVTNSSSTADNPGPQGGTDVYEIALKDGYGQFAGPFTDGGVLSVNTGRGLSYQVGISLNGAKHQLLSLPPLLGDTTNNQAIIFSPPLWQSSTLVPAYPNYTLPAANLSVPDSSFITSNVSLLITKTSARPSLLSGCALRQQDSEGTVIDQRFWNKDRDGWRRQWTLGGLSPSTNYTAYVVVDDALVSGPLSFVTKSASFSCPLLSQLPFCPGIAYAVPLPRPAAPFSTYNATNLPSNISGPLISSLTNFTTILSTFACGRDAYSPLVTCNDCQWEYRRWLCAVSFPRCGESTSSSSRDDNDSAQKVFTALASQPTTAVQRNPNFPSYNETYEVLLPCIERCNAVDRACPTFLKFQCPLPRFTAADSYGVGYVDSGEEGEEGHGLTGTAQDAFGNIWCNWG